MLALKLCGQKAKTKKKQHENTHIKHTHAQDRHHKWSECVCVCVLGNVKLGCGDGGAEIKGVRYLLLRDEPNQNSNIYIPGIIDVRFCLDGAVLELGVDRLGFVVAVRRAVGR